MKKKIIKIFILIIMIISIISFSFAATGTSAGGNEPSIFGQIADLLDIIWLPFAIIAGKLFTNDFVYGATFHIDNTLRNVWNFSRTLANFILGFTFIIGILLFFIGKLQNIFQLIGKIAFGSILVNASWFLLGVILDISTILLVSVGALPMHLMGTSTTGPVQKIKYCSQIEIDPQGFKKSNNGVTNLTICKKGSEKELDSGNFFMMMNNLTGPLFFIGSSILNIDKNWNIDPNQVNGNTGVKKSSKIRNILHIMIVILFVVPIILLVIIGIIRIFRLWIYISFSPLLVLDYLFGGKYISSKNRNFKLSNVIGLIFQPVLVVLAMGIAIIFLATVQTSFIGGGEEDKAKKALGICSEKSLCINNKPVVTMEGSLTKNFMEDVGGAFGYIILTILSFVLMWGLIKMAFHSTEITAGIADQTFKFAEEGLKSVPIIPTANGGVGIGAIQTALSSRLLKRDFNAKAAEQANSIIGKINDITGLGKHSIGPDLEKLWIEKLTNEVGSRTQLHKTFKEFIENIKKEKPEAIPETDTHFQNVVTTFIQNAMNVERPATERFLKKIGVIDSKNKSIDRNKLFRNSDFKGFISGLLSNPNYLNNIQIDQAYNSMGGFATPQLQKELKDF